MKKWILFGIIGLILGVATSIFFLKKQATLPSSELNWNTLAEFDYEKNVASEKLKIFDGTYTKIPGFMVPLEDNNRLVTEFLLVPSPQACIHVPAPPPNQMVYVKIKDGVTAAFGPVWIYGTFKISTKGSVHGDSSFQMDAARVEDYE